MDNSNTSPNQSLSFENISNENDLKTHLEKRVTSRQNTNKKKVQYVCHYTTLPVALSIIKSKCWYIGSPKNMNDGLELDNHTEGNCWDSIFFASFMFEPTESIAMWSMYAQPWRDGVMIKIPIESFKKMLSENPKIYSANALTKEKNNDDITQKVSLSSHFVAYVDSDGNDTLLCGTTKNDKLKNTSTSPQLVGYIKNAAWAYENELRLRVDVKTNDIFEAVAIHIPEYIIDDMVIVAGPRFNGTLTDRINKLLKNEVNAVKSADSIFKGKLNRVYCDSCKNNK